MSSKYFEDLERASLCDIIRADEIDTFVDKEMIFRKEDIHDVINDAHSFLSHICNNICLIRGPSGKLKCRMPDYFGMTQDNIKQSFVDLPNNISDQCWGRLAKTGLANEINCRETGDRNTFNITLGFFHPKRWVPEMHAGETPISPIESRKFCVCRSMKNHQRLTAAGVY